MRICVLFTLLIGLLALVGCGHGVVRTWPERKNVYRQTTDMDLRQLQDDWDTLWLLDRQYRLTRWQMR